MNLQGLIDIHTHTKFSPDAENSAEEMCEAAREKGLLHYGISDHCDINFWDYTDNKKAIDYEMYGSGDYALKSIEKTASLKEKYPFLLCGTELGQPLSCIEKAEIIVNDKRLDYIIGSLHMNNGLNDFYLLEYNKMDKRQIYDLLADYFEQVLEMCKWGGFDILGHLTYPLRYICGEYKISVDITLFADLIREIFCTLIQNGKGIEINCSGLRQSYGKTFPDEILVKMYRELGGEIITLGSDAHKSTDLGKGIEIGAQIAANSGFKYIAYFKNRKSEFVKI